MYSLVMFIVGLFTLPFLFPEETSHWLRKALHWLEARREKRERKIERLDRLNHEQMEWESWVATLHRQLPNTRAPGERYHLLTQALAAGQRYLQCADHRDCPEAYHLTERLCQRLEKELERIRKRARKKGRDLSISPPAVSA